MRRILVVLGCILAVCLTGGIVFGVLWYTGIIGSDTLEQNTVVRFTNQEGGYYTEREWEWTPIESKEVLSYVSTVGTPRQVVSLCLSDDTYYDVTIPMTDYIYDYGKTIWALDGSYMIRVVGDASMNNLSALAGLDNGQNLNTVTLCSQDSTKGAKTIVTLVDSYAIIANVYSDDVTYSILRDSLSSGKQSYYLDEPTYGDNYVTLDALSYTGNIVASVIVQDIDLTARQYLFEDGSLWFSSVYESLTETKDSYLTRLCKASNGSINEVYSDNGIFYARSGDYYLGLISYNSNTTIVLLGDGEESKCNIISAINYLR